MDGRSLARSVGQVITKFSGMGRFIYPWCSAGALRARSSAIISHFVIRHELTRRGWLLHLQDLSRLKFCSEAKLFLLKVMILESGETRWLGMGVVFGDHGTNLMPGWDEGTVGYHTDDRKIFDTLACDIGRKTIGL